MLESKISEVVVLFPSLFCLVLCTSNSFRWAILIWIFILILGIHQQGFGNNVLSPKFLGKWGGGGCWQWINVKLNDHWNKPNTRKEHSRDRGINTCRIQNWSTPSKHVQSGHYRPATETPSEWHFAGRPIVAQVWMLADPWADPGILPGWSRPDCQKTALTTVFVCFCPQLLQFYSGLSMVYFKENYNFTRFQGGGGSNLFQGGGGGDWGSKC